MGACSSTVGKHNIKLKNMKYLKILVPLAVLWGSFYVGQDFSPNSWYIIPYIFTCFSLFLSAVI